MFDASLFGMDMAHFGNDDMHAAAAAAAAAGAASADVNSAAMLAVAAAAAAGARGRTRKASDCLAEGLMPSLKRRGGVGVSKVCSNCHMTIKGMHEKGLGGKHCKAAPCPKTPQQKVCQMRGCPSYVEPCT